MQRVSADFHIPPLSFDEAAEYIDHRLKVAGRTEKLFDASAVQRVAQVTGGVPRKLNVLCDTALVYGFSQEARVITLEIIDEVLRDKAEYGVFEERGNAATAFTRGNPDSKVAELPLDLETARELFPSLSNKNK